MERKKFIHDFVLRARDTNVMGNRGALLTQTRLDLQLSVSTNKIIFVAAVVVSLNISIHYYTTSSRH
jgi:hypothetical protein